MVYRSASHYYFTICNNLFQNPLFVDCHEAGKLSTTLVRPRTAAKTRQSPPSNLPVDIVLFTRPHKPAPMPSSLKDPLMPTTSRSQAYSSPAILLHWLLAALIIGTWCFGVYMHELPFSPMRVKQFNWHKWAGITILGLSALRLLWRLTHTPPALPSHMPTWQQRLSHITHIALYILFFATPLAGWAYSSAAGFQVVLYGVIPLPDWVPVSKDLADTLKALHKFCAMSLAALVLLHIAAALKHQFFDRDGLLRRMMPGG
jgi:cytochrome b561